MRAKIYVSCIFIFIFSACSQEESQPYVEQNNTLSNSQEQGYIQTH